jgi:peptidyl-prolyl cis-trans isomerase D
MRSKGKYIWMVLFIAFVGGYLLLDTSGLLGKALITTGTTIGSVNGTAITYGVWMSRATELTQQREQQGGRSVDLDERAQLDDQAFEELVMDIILHKEYARRHIRVTDEEIRDAARYAPPPALMQNPELQTDGKFDRAKWERFLSNPAVKQQGVLAQLEAYYRDGLPKEKFYSQLASDVYVSDAQLWRLYQDAHDTAQVSYVAFRAAPGADTAAKAQVSDAEVSAYFQAYKKRLNTPARGVVTALMISRKPNAADSAASRARLVAARDRIVKGEKFDAVAKEISDDTVSGKDGGLLPTMAKGAFVKEFEDAAYKLSPGQMSEPVRSPFGWHLIRMESHKGDSVSLRHILVAFKQSDSSATRTDRLADSIAKVAVEVGARLDTASARFGVPKIILDVVEGQRAMGPDGTTLPGLAQWATGGSARIGDISDLFDSDSAYFIARLDSLTPGGEAPLSRVQENIRMVLAHRKAVQARMQDAKDFASAAVKTSLEDAAKQRNLKIESTGATTRTSFSPGLGQGSPVIGAAFGLASGAISEPVTADDGLYVIRVDRRKNADHNEWQKQAAAQRLQVEQQAQQERWRQYVGALREQAKVVDKRKEIFAAGRRQTQ